MIDGVGAFYFKSRVCFGSGVSVVYKIPSSCFSIADHYVKPQEYINKILQTRLLSVLSISTHVQPWHEELLSIARKGIQFCDLHSYLMPAISYLLEQLL